MAGQDPFGFGSASPDPDDNEPGKEPIPGLPAGFDMNTLGAALEQLGQLLRSGGADSVGPVNWKLANDTARNAIAQAGDPSVPDSARRAVGDAVSLANVWLDSAMTFPATAGDALAWSRSEWLQATLPAWQKIVEPIAAQLETTMAGLLPGSDTDENPGQVPGLPEGLPPELAAMAGPMLGMAKSMGSAMFGMQVGQGLAALAAEVISAGDVGIPLTSDGHAALIPTNITTFGSGIDVPDSEIMVFVALREAAHQRLFTSVPWLRGRVQGAVEGYAVGIKVDPSRIEGAFGGIDPSNPEALQNALASGVFEQEDTAEQKAALLRLETLLALIEGWVDDVVDAAVSDRLPSAERLRETLRRRRAIGGPAEKTFATLVGLELRPRRLREAALFWQTLREDKGIEGRDAIWEHPDLLPNGEDLSDVPEFFSREKLMDFNASDFEDKPQQED